MTVDYEILDEVESTDSSWEDWKQLIIAEGWNNKDCSVLHLTPQMPNTKVVVARHVKDGAFIGSVVWSECDEVSYIISYLLAPEERGKGVGSIIWKRAMERMRREIPIGLRAVPLMKPKYQSSCTPHEVSSLFIVKMKWQKAIEIAQKYQSGDKETRNIRDLTSDEWRSLQKFDTSVVGKDRSDFLPLFFDYPLTEGEALIDGAGAVTAYAGITTILKEDSGKYKLAPVFASTIKDAMAVVAPIIRRISERDANANILMHIVSGTIGEEVLSPLLISEGVTPVMVASTLYSTPYKNPSDRRKMFAPHNHTCNIDA